MANATVQAAISLDLRATLTQSVRRMVQPQLAAVIEAAKRVAVAQIATEDTDGAYVDTLARAETELAQEQTRLLRIIGGYAGVQLV